MLKIGLGSGELFPDTTAGLRKAQMRAQELANSLGRSVDIQRVAEAKRKPKKAKARKARRKAKDDCGCAAETEPQCEPAPRTKAKPLSKMKQSDWAVPPKKGEKKGVWNIADEYHSTLSLVWLTWPQHKNAPAKKILAAIKKKFPDVYRCEADLVKKVKKLHKIN